MADQGGSPTPPQDTGPPDPAERDAAALSSAEDLDEDRLRVDPLEAGMDPPEKWTAADRYGTTAGEEAEPESLGDRITAEQPDVQPDPGARPTAADAPTVTGAEAADATQTADTETGLDLGPDLEEQVADEAVGRGQIADEAGGSVAAEMRDPDDRE